LEMLDTLINNVCKNIVLSYCIFFVMHRST